MLRKRNCEREAHMKHMLALQEISKQVTEQVKNSQKRSVPALFGSFCPAKEKPEPAHAKWEDAGRTSGARGQTLTLRVEPTGCLSLAPVTIGQHGQMDGSHDVVPTRKAQ